MGGVHDPVLNRPRSYCHCGRNPCPRRIWGLALVHQLAVLDQHVAPLAGPGCLSAIFSSSAFWSAFGHTWFWTIGTVIIEVGIGLPLALLLSRPTKVSGVMTSLLLLPWVTPFVVVSYSWLYLLGTGGPIHSVLQGLGIVGQASPLASPTLALPTLTIISGWKGLLFMTVALLARAE